MTETTKPAPAKAAGARARVLKKGDGKISKGVIVGGERQYYAKGDEVSFPDEIAVALEARGYIDIL